jgi:hypothetical protein
MKVSFLFTLAAFLFCALLVAQTSAPKQDDPARAFHEQLRRDGVTVTVSAEAAQTMLVKKVDPVVEHHAMEARVMGTVVMGLEIGKSGDVIKLAVVSGPRLLQKPVFDAVRQYKFKPYFVDGRPHVFSTILSIPYSNWP